MNGFVSQNAPCYTSTLVQWRAIGLIVTNLAVLHSFPFRKVYLVSYLSNFIVNIIGVKELAHSQNCEVNKSCL